MLVGVGGISVSPRGTRWRGKLLKLIMNQYVFEAKCVWTICTWLGLKNLVWNVSRISKIKLLNVCSFEVGSGNLYFVGLHTTVHESRFYPPTRPRTNQSKTNNSQPPFFGQPFKVFMFSITFNMLITPNLFINFLKTKPLSAKLLKLVLTNLVFKKFGNSNMSNMTNVKNSAQCGSESQTQKFVKHPDNLRSGIWDMVARNTFEIWTIYSGFPTV